MSRKENLFAKIKEWEDLEDLDFDLQSEFLQKYMIIFQVKDSYFFRIHKTEIIIKIKEKDILLTNFEIIDKLKNINKKIVNTNFLKLV